jgi:4-hydroxy-tetrahydrodipicolinate synthase
MHGFKHLAGVYAAAVTPLRNNDQFFPQDLPALLAFLARRGCHGALILGTTGEGPSFSIAERLEIYRAAVQVRQEFPDFRLLAGTGTPSLEDTLGLTRAAFELGYDGVVVLPPYYFRKATTEGLFQWYARLLQNAVPRGGALLGYHIPAVSGVGLPIELLARLKDAFPTSFAGLKDSTGDPEHARLLGEQFGDELLVFTGNDILLSHALEQHASGCITALANLASPDLRRVWDSFQEGAWQSGGRDEPAQARLDYRRKVLDRYPPTPSMLKALLNRQHGFPSWTVRLPLLSHESSAVELAAVEIDNLPSEIAGA